MEKHYQKRGGCNDEQICLILAEGDDEQLHLMFTEGDREPTGLAGLPLYRFCVTETSDRGRNQRENNFGLHTHSAA